MWCTQVTAEHVFCVSAIAISCAHCACYLRCYFQAPNDDSEVLGDVKATANQGSAVAGAFSLTNSFGTAEQVSSWFASFISSNRRMRGPFQ